MKIITNEEIENLNLSIKKMLNIAENVIRHKNKYILPPKISMKQENDSFYNVMP